MQEAGILFNKSNALFSNLGKTAKEPELQLINTTYKKISDLFSEVSKLCTLSSVDIKSETMEFDMKTASMCVCVLIPVLDDKESTMK